MRRHLDHESRRLTARAEAAMPGTRRDGVLLCFTGTENWRCLRD